MYSVDALLIYDSLQSRWHAQITKPNHKMMSKKYHTISTVQVTKQVNYINTEVEELASSGSHLANGVSVNL